MRIFKKEPPHGGKEQERHEGELRDKGFEVVERSAPVVPIIGLRCQHPPERLRITAKGRSAIMVRCLDCGRVGPFVPIPERQLNSAETDLMVALAREAAWLGRIA